MSNKETLDTIKQMVADGVLGQEAAEKYFPELAESEDEKIRKGIIALVEQSSEILAPKNQQCMIAYLEKQGEKNSIKYDFLKKFGFTENGYDPMNILMTIKQEWPMVWEKMLYQERKPEWSEEDLIMIDKMIKNFEAAQKIAEQANFSYLPEINFLKSLKDRRSKQWEPTEGHLKGLRRGIKNTEVGTDAWYDLQDLYEQLKELSKT